MTPTEITLAALAATGILGMATFATVFAWVWYPAWERRRRAAAYPHVVPGCWGLRVSDIPVSTIRVDDVARGVVMFVNRAEAKGYDRAALIDLIARATIRFVRGVDGRRYVVDEYGRQIAGDSRLGGREMMVVVIDGDEWQSVAGFHELGHLAHRTRDRVDYEHRDDVMWHEIVGWCKSAFKA